MKVDEKASDKALAGSAPIAGERRKAAPRDSMFLQATLRRGAAGTPCTMRVRNLSPGGMMAEIGEPFAEGDHVEIELRGVGALGGTVAWRLENRIGIAFDTPIDPQRARKTVSHRPPPPPAAAADTAPRAIKRPKLFGD